jgi:endonuclease/exonuclease/phosphatase family metal-dependent hydrolase
MWPLRRQATATVLLDLEPDVAGVQEAWRCQVRYLVRRLGGYDAAGVGRNNGGRWGEHCAVLYRRDRFVLERHRTRWFSDRPDAPGSRTWGNTLPRIVTMVWLRDRHDGRRFGVANAHLDEEHEDIRIRSTAALVAWIDEIRAAGDDRPWLVIGDLNATPADPSVRQLLAAGWHDVLATVPADGPGAATGNWFTDRRDGARIDHILAEDAWTVDRAAIVHARPGGRMASDHWPVVAYLH